MFKRKKKLSINWDYLHKYRSIRACNEQDIIEHRMLHDDMFYSVEIDKGWTCYATLKMEDGKRFSTRWYVFGLEELQDIYIDALRYFYGRKGATKPHHTEGN